MLAEARIEFDQTVEIREDRGRIVIEPLRRKVFALHGTPYPMLLNIPKRIELTSGADPLPFTYP